MLVQDIISLAQRSAGIVGVGQVALAQDTADAQSLLLLMLKQWRQRRWLVFRLDNVTFPLLTNKPTYSVGPATSTPVPDVVVTGNFRPANIQSCYLRQNVGSGPNSFPVDFPMTILKSRQEYDAIRLKNLGSWPSQIWYDPTIPNAELYIWPIPIQNFFSLYIGFQQAIDLAPEEGENVDFAAYVPEETEEAILWNLAQKLIAAYKLPPDQNVASQAKATLNTLRNTNYGVPPLRMPSALWGSGRVRNPMAGFYYEVSAGIPVTVLQ